MTIYGSNLYRHPPEVVTAALELADAGWTNPQIARILEGRGIRVSTSSIERWRNPKRCEADRAANRERAKRRSAELRAQRGPQKYPGLTGLALKLAKLEDRVAALESERKAA